MYLQGYIPTIQNKYRNLNYLQLKKKKRTIKWIPVDFFT